MVGGTVCRRGSFSGSCVTLARNVIAPHFGDDGTATCAATQRTRLFVYFGTACFNVEEGVGETEEEQLACALAADRAVQEFNVTVDGGETVRLVRRRFELVSPQTTVPVPPGSGYDAVTATFTAHAWGAVIRRLRPGRHTVAIEVVADFGTFHVTVASTSLEAVTPTTRTPTATTTTDSPPRFASLEKARPQRAFSLPLDRAAGSRHDQRANVLAAPLRQKR